MPNIVYVQAVLANYSATNGSGSADAYNYDQAFYNIQALGYNVPQTIVVNRQTGLVVGLPVQPNVVQQLSGTSAINSVPISSSSAAIYGSANDLASGDNGHIYVALTGSGGNPTGFKIFQSISDTSPTTSASWPGLSGQCYYVDTLNSDVYGIDGNRYTTGNGLYVMHGDGPAISLADGTFAAPTANIQGKALIADENNNGLWILDFTSVRFWSPTGPTTTTITIPGAGAGNVENQGFCLDSTGTNLYVVGISNSSNTYFISVINTATKTVSTSFFAPSFIGPNIPSQVLVSGCVQFFSGSIWLVGAGGQNGSDYFHHAYIFQINVSTHVMTTYEKTTDYNSTVSSFAISGGRLFISGIKYNALAASVGTFSGSTLTDGTTNFITDKVQDTSANGNVVVPFVIGNPFTSIINVTSTVLTFPSPAFGGGSYHYWVLLPYSAAYLTADSSITADLIFVTPFDVAITTDSSITADLFYNSDAILVADSVVTAELYSSNITAVLSTDSYVTSNVTVITFLSATSFDGDSTITATITEAFYALAAVSDDTTITLSFAPYLEPDGIADLGNYVITPLAGAPPIGLLGVVPILFGDSIRGVVLQTLKQRNGARYSITVSGLNDPLGDPYEGTALFTAVATRPRVISASYLGNGQVVLTFSISMRPDEYLTSPSEFTITGPSTVEVTSVQTVSSTQVVLYTNGLGAGSYTVTVNTSGTPHDIGGNPVDPAYASVVFISTPPITQRSIFTDKGPVSKPPLTLQSGINALIVRPALTFDLQPHKDLTTLTLPGGTVTSAMVGLYVTLTGSDVNDGTYMITFVLSPTSVRVNANFHLPDVMNGAMNWSVVDPRNGQIADSPSDVSVTINGSGVIPTDVIGLLGQVVLATVPTDGDTVLVNYSWVNNPTVDFAALNDPQFRLNSWNRDVGYPSEVRHHYRYNNQLVVPSDGYNSTNIQSTLAQPEQRDLKYRAYERAYTPVLNDPNLLTLNNPIHKVSFPPMSREINSVFVSYGATVLPENDPVAPWTRNGVGTTTLGSDLLTVTKTAAGPFPTGQVLFWNRLIDLTFPAVFAAAWRGYITAAPTTEGVFTGVAAGYSNGSKAIVVGFLLVAGVAQIGVLQAGGDDPSILASWAGGLDTSGNPTNAPAVFDWTVIHSYRLYEDTSGNIRLYIDGNVVETLRVTEAELPYLEELSSPFNELQGVFFGSLSRAAVNTSVWEFVRYNIIPTNPVQTAPSVFVTYTGNMTPETATQPWTPVGSAGTETILASSFLILDSTSATDEVTEEAAGLVSGDFRGYDRIEPLLSSSSDVVLDVNVQLRTFTHGITPNAVMAAVDDGTYLVQLCFFPDVSSPKLSYGGRALPTAFSPYTWTAMGGQTAAMLGRYLRVTDTSLTDGLIYFIDDSAPLASTDRVVSSTTDYMLEFRARVESFTVDVVTHFAGVNADIYDGLRSVGVMLTTVAGVPNVTFHSEGVAFDNLPFNWNDGKYHTYRLVKSTLGNLVTLFIDTTLIGSTNYSNFSVPGGSLVGVVSFGSSNPSTTGSLSVVDWAYCNCWRVLPTLNRYVGIWKGTNPDSLMGYHLPIKSQGTQATVNNNALGDGAANFIAAGVQIGDYIIIDYGPNAGMYSVASVATTVLTITGVFPFGPTTAAYRVPSQTDWTTAHRYRVVRDPGGGVSVLFDSLTAPLISLGYNEADLPPSPDGVPWVVNGALPGIVWGAFDPTNISQTSWNYVKYGITKNPGANRIVPPHQVLNQNNVIASYERQLSNLPHTVTDFWSGSTGIPPELEPDFLQNPGLVAFTLLNEGTPLVPSTQTFEVRRPTPMNVPIASLNSPSDILNTQQFTLNNADFEVVLVVPPDVLYNSLQVIERDTGSPNLIAPFDDQVTTLGTLSFQNEVCLIYDAQTLPENDLTAITPWAFQADDPTHVQRSVFSGVLTFGTDSTGTRAIYRNATPLPDAVGLSTQVTFRLKLLSDASLGLGDTQVRFGMSATNMTLALGFVTTPLGQRYLLVYDQNTGNVIGGKPFDFLDGNYHQFRVLRNPGAGTVSIFIDS
jgi:hypothetical protein